MSYDRLWGRRCRLRESFGLYRKYYSWCIWQYDQIFLALLPAKPPFSFYLVYYLYITFIRVPLTSAWAHSSLHTFLNLIYNSDKCSLLQIGVIKTMTLKRRLSEITYFGRRGFLQISAPCAPRTSLTYTWDRSVSYSSAIRISVFPVLSSTSPKLCRTAAYHHSSIFYLEQCYWQQSNKKCSCAGCHSMLVSTDVYLNIEVFKNAMFSKKLLEI